MPTKISLTTDNTLFEGGSPGKTHGRPVSDVDLKILIKDVQAYAQELINERRTIVYDLIVRI